MPRNVDLTQHYINIDTIVDAMVEEEKQHGKSSSMILATYNEDTGSKIRRYQRNEEGIMNAETLPTENRISDKKKEEVVEEETQKEESNDCQKCPHKCNEEKKEKSFESPNSLKNTKTPRMVQKTENTVSKQHKVKSKGRVQRDVADYDVSLNEVVWTNEEPSNRYGFKF